ncbi:hypothetical protein HK098_000329 [Nowakowskiella sp. JEL0407]|nr:hypothetical protein HK098_000329 [Nowakowskiella sp. JEL0407]
MEKRSLVCETQNEQLKEKIAKLETNQDSPSSPTPKSTQPNKPSEIPDIIYFRLEETLNLLKRDFNLDFLDIANPKLKSVILAIKQYITAWGFNVPDVNIDDNSSLNSLKFEFEAFFKSKSTVKGSDVQELLLLYLGQVQELFNEIVKLKESENGTIDRELNFIATRIEIYLQVVHLLETHTRNLGKSQAVLSKEDLMRAAAIKALAPLATKNKADSQEYAAKDLHKALIEIDNEIMQKFGSGIPNEAMNESEQTHASNIPIITQSTMYNAMFLTSLSPSMLLQNLQYADGAACYYRQQKD